MPSLRAPLRTHAAVPVDGAPRAFSGWPVRIAPLPRASATAPLRVLHLISSVDPRMGGPSECVRQYCRHLGALPARFEIATLDAPREPYLDDFPVPVHALGPAQGRYRYTPRLRPWLRGNARRFDIVVVHGLWQFQGLAAWSELRRAGVPYLVFPHGMLDPWFNRAYPFKHLKKRLYWPAEYRILRDARAVLFTAEDEARLAATAFRPYQVASCVIRYGIAAPEGHAVHQRTAFEAAFPDLAGKRQLLFLGRIHPKKGCDLLIRAFAAIAGRDPALLLVMAGPDSAGWQPALAALAAQLGVSSRITWTGMLSGDLKWGALLACDAFVLPSHQENFGIAVVEALACSKPVLISDQVNIWREIARSGAGLVEPDTADGTLALLTNWLDATEAQRDRMRMRALAGFYQHFEIGSALASFVDAASDAVRGALQPSVPH